MKHLKQQYFVRRPVDARNDPNIRRKKWTRFEAEMMNDTSGELSQKSTHLEQNRQ